MLYITYEQLGTKSDVLINVGLPAAIEHTKLPNNK